MKNAAAPTHAVIAANANSFLFCEGASTPAAAGAYSALSLTRDADAVATVLRGLAA